MQVASPDSVLGDFSGVTVPYFDSGATFTARDNQFFVKTDNASGELVDFRITHTFGVTPLQQYLVELPGGRKQALQYAWDSRPAENGGQRWYHLYPDDYVGPGDPLHWTGRYFNWNYMCAECHSTNLKLGYDIDTDTFDTSWSEISVGCEACHGPAYTHLAQAESGEFDASKGLLVSLDDRDGSSWVVNANTGIAERSAPATARQQPETCGRCHARRSPVAANYEHGVPLTDTHMVSLLEEPLYHADGRINEEVYVYGSFVQSKMYAAGVTCSDCHDPHSGNLRTGPDPNDVCSTCHLPTKFAGTEHGVPAGDCVSCHMPATTYMGVDDRRDHSFRLPNTSGDASHYGALIAAGRDGESNSELLTGIANQSYPAIARATLLTLLQPSTDPAVSAGILQQLDDPDALVRIGALRALRQQESVLRVRYGSHLLADPIRSVRVEAALTYIDVRDLLPLEHSRAFARAADEYRESLQTAASMPDAVLNLADFEMRLGNNAASAKLFEHAIRIGSDSAAVQHAYGLHLVRAGRAQDALAYLERATALDAGQPRFVFVYGVALNSLARPDEAIEVLRSAYEKFPNDFDVGWALATVYRDVGELEAARAVATELQSRLPDDERALALTRYLQE